MTTSIVGISAKRWRMPLSKTLWFGVIIAFFFLPGYLTVYYGFIYKHDRARSFVSRSEMEEIPTDELLSPVIALETPTPKSEATTMTRTTATKKIPAARPRIAFWSSPYHKIEWTFPQLKNGDGGCDISFKREDVADADAVLFFMKSCKPSDLPPRESRRPSQVYVWFSHESPWTTLHYYGHKLTEFDKYFNWTMTYRTDSDIIASMWPTPAMDYLMYRVGRTEEMLDTNLAANARLNAQEYKHQVKVLLAIKTDLISWIVSDCSITKGAKRRLEAVKALEDTGIKLSKFGKCAGKVIPFSFNALYDTLSPYKFYLAFENSIHCQDYLTEKTIYNSFISGAVPVIHGPTKKDVEKILPKGSYIFVEDFDNVQNLTDYLNYLDRHDSAYMEYFKWWMEPGAQTFPRYGFNFGPEYVPRNLALPQYNQTELQDNWLEYERFGLYHLCRRLKRGDQVTQHHVISNLAHWWYETQPPECHNTHK